MVGASGERRGRILTGESGNASLHRTRRSLRDNEVAVWWLPTGASEPDDWRRWHDLLDAAERDRAARFHFEHDRREYIAAHALLRTMLTVHLDRPARDWQFVADESGKPSLAGDAAFPGCRFNLSHTRGLVSVAIATHGRLGVDVEAVDPRKADLAVANAYFAPSEVALLQRMPAADQPEWFFRLWTLKESYIKAIGTGLGTPLDSFEFAFDPVRISFAGGGDDPGRWHFSMLPASDRHILSVAVDRPSDAIEISSRAILPGEL